MISERTESSGLKPFSVHRKLTPPVTRGQYLFLILSLWPVRTLLLGLNSPAVGIPLFCQSNLTLLYIEPPSGQLRLASPAGIKLASDIFSSVASVFPSKYISTGGDELNANCYDDDPETQASLQASGQTLEEALNTFLQATQGALIKAGKTPVISEEMVLNYNVTLANDTIAMSVSYYYDMQFIHLFN